MVAFSANKTVETEDQYSLIKILGIWALAAIPMRILSWIVFPVLSPDFNSDPLGTGVTRVVLLTLGLIWFFALSVVFALFNTILGEEFLFRGLLLPKMKGVFVKWSWVANGVLFGFYHLHQPWGIVGSVVSGVFLYTFPAWRFRSTWMAIIVHSAQSVFFAFLILGIVLGLA